MPECRGLCARCHCQMVTGRLSCGSMRPDAWSLSRFPGLSGFQAGMSRPVWWMPMPIPLWGEKRGCRWLWMHPRL
jgi:hypothetical protein